MNDHEFQFALSQVEFSERMNQTLSGKAHASRGGLDGHQFVSSGLKYIIDKKSCTTTPSTSKKKYEKIS